MSEPGLLSRLLRQDPASLRKRAEAEDAKGDFVASAELWRRLAEAGDAQAQMILGERYETGRGVVQSFVMATRLFRQAAEAGVAAAQAKLGETYFHGRGAPGSVS